jgi:hypothetical protein
MADLSTPTQVKEYFETVIVANHIELAHFAYGSHQRLEKVFSKAAKKDEYVLYLEWPEKRYADQDGSITARLQPHIGVYRAVNKENDARQDLVIDKCYEILDDIIIRMRSEIFLQGNVFSINDIGTIQPVYHMMIDNAFGCRVQMAVGDWISTQVNTGKWSDR